MFGRVELTLDLVEAYTYDLTFDYKDLNPPNAAPSILWLSTIYCQIDLVMKVNRCLQIEEHK